MGFEYKLKAKLTERQTTEIQYLLANTSFFDKKYLFNNNLFWDFRYVENMGEIPNISIIFENDGIYICQYSSSYLWTNLDELKIYMADNQIEYEVIDYQE